MLPNFYYVGSSKCGSSALHDILDLHPDIFLPKVKETEFFRLNFEKGLDWYQKQYFSEYSGEHAVGEIQPCLSEIDAPKRLFDALGKDLKILAILRNPVDRAYSHFLAQREIHNYQFGFEDALRRVPIFVENGLYAKHLLRFRKYFPEEAFKIIVYESEFKAQQSKTISSIHRFIGVDEREFLGEMNSNVSFVSRSRIVDSFLYRRPRWIDTGARMLIPSHNIRRLLARKLAKLNRKSQTYVPLDETTKIRLQKEYFSDDIRELKVLLKRDLVEWDISN